MPLPEHLAQVQAEVFVWLCCGSFLSQLVFLNSIQLPALSFG